MYSKWQLRSPKKYFSEKHEVLNALKTIIRPGGGGARLQSQHLGGRGRRTSEFEASLVSSRTARITQRNPVSEKKKKKKGV